MVTYYKNEKTGEIICEWEYDNLTIEEREDYVYMGMWSRKPWPDEPAPQAPDCERVVVGQKVTGAFRSKLFGGLKEYGWNPIGTVIEADRNRFKVQYPVLKGMVWTYYYKDVGRIVFPHRVEK